MTTEQLLEAMHEIGVRVKVRDGKPFLTGRQPPPVLLNALKFHREAILKLVPEEKVPEMTDEEMLWLYDSSPFMTATEMEESRRWREKWYRQHGMTP